MHSRSPERFLTAVAEMIKQGCGFPKLLNDDEIIPLHLAKGAPLEDIYDYAASGCAEIRMPRVDTYTSGHAQMNFGAAVELVLYNGRMKKYGDIVLGEETGDPRNFKTWDEFWNAYVKQHMLFLRTAFTQQYIVNNLRAQHFAQPMGSAMHDLCMKHCIDLHQTHIPEGVDFGYFEYMGLGTVVDSLSAIKKLVFEDKKLTMDEVIKAIDANFEGYEDVSPAEVRSLLRQQRSLRRQHRSRDRPPVRGIRCQVQPEGPGHVLQRALRALHLSRALR